MKTLLVADDDADFRRFVRCALAPTGCQIIEASDGLDALVKLRAVRPSLMVMDYDFGIPPNGAAVLATLREERDFQHLPVVFATGTHLGTASNDAQGVLYKPVDPADLLAMVGRLLGN